VKITTFAHDRVPGWPSFDPLKPPGTAEPMDLADALTREWPTDRHIQAIAPWSAEGAPRRVNVARLTDEQLATAPVSMVIRMLDIDTPGHAARTPEWTAELRALVEALPCKPLLYWTNGGARMLWALAEPFVIRSQADVARWKSEQLAAIRAMRAYGIEADEACKEPGRLFRLPNVVRKEKGTQTSELEGEVNDWAYDAPADPMLDALDGEAPKAGAVGEMRILQACGEHRLIGEGKAAVKCPHADQHSDAGQRDPLAGGTIVFATRDGEGWLHCSHAHCAKRTQNEWREALGLEALTGSDIERLAPGWLRHNPRASDVPWWEYTGGVWRERAAAEIYAGLASRVPELGDLARSPGKQVAMRMRLLRQHEAHVLVESELDPDPLILNCPNGIVDLRSGALLPHTPGALCSKQAGVTYDPTTSAHDVERLMLSWCGGRPDVAEELWAVVGYTLTGLAHERVLPWLLGPKGSGKTTFLELLQHVMGSYAVQVQSGRTWVDDGGREPADSIRSTRGCRLAWTDELPKRGRWREDIVKSFTGGGGNIAAEAKYRGRAQWTQRCKLWLASNNEPADADDALASRIRVYPFERSFADPTFKLRLKETHGAAFLARAVRAAARFTQTMVLPTRAAAVASATELATESDMGSWLKGYAAGDSETRAAELFERWTAENPGTDIRTPQKFGRRMREFSQLYPRIQREPGAYYQGLKLGNRS
jgi:P4 family phage/plasmid primase-like protien